MSIGNRLTGEVQTADPAAFFHPSDPMHRGRWCTDWLVEHVAAGIATLECHLGYPFLEWDDAEEGVELREPGELDAEHWTASFRWRISKPKPYAGCPD